VMQAHTVEDFDLAAAHSVAVCWQHGLQLCAWRVLWQLLSLSRLKDLGKQVKIGQQFLPHHATGGASLRRRLHNQVPLRKHSLKQLPCQHHGRHCHSAAARVTLPVLGAGVLLRILLLGQGQLGGLVPGRLPLLLLEHLQARACQRSGTSASKQNHKPERQCKHESRRSKRAWVVLST